MNLEQLHFLKLSEECHEVGQECSKIMQFGLDEVYAPIGISNRERQKRELQDLYAVVQILNEDFDLGFVPSPEAVEVKRQKIAHYARYSQVIGTVDSDDCVHRREGHAYTYEMSSGNMVCVNCGHKEVV